MGFATIAIHSGNEPDPTTGAVTVPIIAEGRYWHPEQVAKAFAAGAHAVVVGTAITATGWLVGQFLAATPARRS